MSALPLGERIAARAAMASVAVSPVQLDALVSYYLLLERWNRKINLTSLALEARDDSTIDRLIVEGLIATDEFEPGRSVRWLDFGSGGGSPAIPIKIARPDVRLTMIESRERKSAFLREATSILRLTDTRVETARIQDVLTGCPDSSVDVVTVRALRLDSALTALTRAALKPEGKVLLFQSEASASPTEGFAETNTCALYPSAGFLVTLSKRSG